VARGGLNHPQVSGSRAVSDVTRRARRSASRERQRARQRAPRDDPAVRSFSESVARGGDPRAAGATIEIHAPSEDGTCVRATREPADFCRIDLAHNLAPPVAAGRNEDALPASSR